MESKNASNHQPQRHDLSEEEIAALKARMDDSAGAAAPTDRLAQVDRLLRETPLVAPSVEFASRVMAAIAAMDLPELSRRRLATGFAVGMAVAGLLILPVLSGLALLLVSTLTNPGLLNSGFQLVANGIGYGVSLAADLGASLDEAVNETPMLPALVSTVIPITMLWMWSMWYLLLKPRWVPDQADML